MKLYATVASERATKGQGGNKYIYAEFSVDRDRVGEVELELLDDGEWLLKYRANDLMDWDILRQGSIDILETRKGKKQKGENDTLICTRRGCNEPQGAEMEFCEKHYK